jgi:glycosyltransferase involved in cell wall biosynthesis
MNAAAPLVSVVTCIHDGERFLNQAMESALAQSYQNLEILAVDDGSSDRSLAILENMADPRVRIIRQSRQGPAAALATGINAAKGCYIAFLDQDDCWSPEYAAAHAELLNQRPEVDLSFSWFRVIDGEGRWIGIESSRFRGTIDFPRLFADFVIGASSNVVVRAQAVRAAGGVDPALARYYDLDLCLRVALLRPHNVAAIPRDLMFYRRHGSQITRDIQGMQQEWKQVVAKLHHLAPVRVEPMQAEATSNMQRYFARLAYEGLNYSQGLAFLASAFRTQPGGFLTDRRNWLTAAACIAGLSLPRSIHQRLEKIAGLCR